MMNDNDTLEPGDDFLVSPGIYDVSGQLMGNTSDGIIPEFVSVPIQVISEPSTVLLLVIGLAAMLSHRKRIRNSY
jgi:hypothetical protein